MRKLCYENTIKPLVACRYIDEIDSVLASKYIPNLTSRYVVPCAFAWEISHYSRTWVMR